MIIFFLTLEPRAFRIDGLSLSSKPRDPPYRRIQLTSSKIKHKMDPSSPNDKVKFPEVEAETKTTKYFHLYNCDETYKLDSAEKLLKSIREKLRFDISIAQHYFRLREMSETCERINSEPQMDFVIFVVHAHEPDLSINEDNAGISYAKIYRALLQKTGELLDDISFSRRLLLQKIYENQTAVPESTDKWSMIMFKATIFYSCTD